MGNAKKLKHAKNARKVVRDMELGRRVPGGSSESAARIFNNFVQNKLVDEVSVMEVFVRIYVYDMTSYYEILFSRYV